MSNAKLVADWNEIFDYKIKENDLQNPSEKFVFNVLVDYLRKFNMDSAAMINYMSYANPEARRNFKIRFCAYIEHIYKVSCADDKSFVYFDLVKPSPKKTIHLLKTILNYYVYVQMLEEETISLALSEIKAREHIIKKKTDYQAELESQKKEMEELEQEIIHFKSTLPSLKEKLEDVKSTEREQTDKIAHLKDTIRNYEAILSQLKCKEDMLKCELVSDKEIESLAANKAILEQAISEQNEIEKNTLTSGNDRKKTLQKMEPTVGRLQTLANRYPIEDLNSFKAIKTKLQQLEEKYGSQRAINEKKKFTIESNSEKLSKFENTVREKRNDLLNISKEYDIETTKIMRSIENRNAMVERLDQNIDTLEAELEEKKKNREFVEETVESVVKYIMGLTCSYES